MSQPQSLTDLLAASAARFGARPLFLTKDPPGQVWGETTYRQFADMVDKARAGLAALGVGPGDTVGIIAKNCIEWVVGAYATYGRRAAYVPMYETQSREDWAFIIRDSGIKVLFVATPEIYAVVQGLRAQFPALKQLVLLTDGAADVTFASLLARGAAAPATALHPTPQDTACLLYTSGTTGDPKGVTLSHANIMSNVSALASVIPLSEEYRTLSILPWAHAFGHTVELHMVISCGASMALAEGVDKIAANFGEVKPVIIVAVPRVFLKVYAGVEKLMALKPAPIRWLFRRGVAAARRRTEGAALGFLEKVIFALADALVLSKIRARFGGRLKFAVSGGAALPREAADLINGLGIAVYEGYGLTETSPIVAANVPGFRKMGSVGRPLPGVRVVIDRSANKDGDPSHGEIVVYGPNVSRGYHNGNRGAASMFTPDGGLRTGDLGYLDADNYLFITGRIKEQYKLANGKYVVPAPLEDRLKLSPFLTNVMVHGENKAFNVALVVPDVAAVTAWAAKRRIAVGGPSELTRHPQVRALIAAELEKFSAGFRGYEKIRAFTLIDDDFTQDNDMLTPTLKLKRRNVVLRWRAELEELCRDTSTASRDADHVLPERAASTRP